MRSAPVGKSRSAEHADVSPRIRGDLGYLRVAAGGRISTLGQARYGDLFGNLLQTCASAHILRARRDPPIWPIEPLFISSQALS